MVWDKRGSFCIWDSIRDKQADRMSAHFLKELGFTLTSERGVNELSGAWKSDPYWLSWGTKFDGTDLVYYLPEVYEALVLFTNKKFDYVPVRKGDICLYVVGFYRGRRGRCVTFWHDSFNDKMKHATPRMMWHLTFVRNLQKDLDDYEAGRQNLWCPWQSKVWWLGMNGSHLKWRSIGMKLWVM